MAAKGKSSGGTKKILNIVTAKGTSIGRGKVKTSTMSKDQKRNYKKYRGQG